MSFIHSLVETHPLHTQQLARSLKASCRNYVLGLESPRSEATLKFQLATNESDACIELQLGKQRSNCEK